MLRLYVIAAVLVVLSAGSVCEAALPQYRLRTGALTEAGEIILRVRDNLSGVDPLSVRLVIDGREVKPSLAKITQGYSVSYTPAGSTTGEYNVELFASDMAKNSMRQAYRFIGKPSVIALANPKRLLPDGPMLRAVGGESNVASRLIQGEEPTPISMAPAVEDPRRSQSLMSLGLVSPFLKEAEQFKVAIAEELIAADQDELYKVTFDISANHSVNEEYELFIGLIDLAGEVVFYEPEAGRYGIALEELEQTEDLRFRLKLSFEPGEMRGGNYTWRAVVARAGRPEHVVSNVAKAPFDVSPPESEVLGLDDLSSFP